MIRNEWQDMCCATQRDFTAIKSWFSGLLPENYGDPVRAQTLEDPETGRTKKIRALFRVEDRLKMGAITLGARGRTYSFGLPSAGILKGFSQ